MYPAHSVNGISLTDPAGRWHESPSADTLPSFPGLRASSFELPGVGGSVAAATAPHRSSTTSMEIVFNAVDAGGKIVSGIGDRAAAISAHIDAFLLASGLGAAGTAGATLELSRAVSPTSARACYGRVEASSDPQYEIGADHAVMKLVFAIPEGVWYQASTVSNPVAVNAMTSLDNLKGGTAPVSDPRIGIAGPITNPTVTNLYGQGFQLLLTIPAGMNVTVDAKSWAYSDTFGGGPNTTRPASLRSAIRPIGAVSGTALTIPPHLNGGLVSLTGSGTTADTRLWVRARKAFF